MKPNRVFRSIAVLFVVAALAGIAAVHFLASSQRQEARMVDQLRARHNGKFAERAEYVGTEMMRSWGPKWLTRMFERVVAISVEGDAPTPQQLAPFQFLSEFDLRGCRLTDSQLNDLLPQLRHVRSLYLSDTQCIGVGLSSLAVDSLDELLLDRTLLNDAGLAAVGNLSHVVELDISECALISSRGIAHLKDMAIEDLNVSWCNLDDSVIPILSSMVGLQSLNLSGNPISGDGFEKCAREMRLVDLDLSYTAITDSQLKHLSQLDSIEYLRLDGTNVTVEGIEAIASLPHLKYLSIGNTTVNEDAVEVLLKLPSLSAVVIGKGQLSEKTLEQMKRSRPELRIHEQHEFERKANLLQMEVRVEVDW
jgi:hypothetical protein